MSIWFSMGGFKPKAPLSPTIDASDMAQTADDLNYRTTTRRGGAPPPPASEAPPPLESDEKPVQAGTQPPRIGRYILLRAIGEGGMGVVYAAYDEELDRKVAVKILHPSRRGDDQLRSRILREAQALARVSSPGVVHVYQVGETGGQIYIAMEFVNGTTLSKWQAEPGRSWQEILRMYSAAGRGLLSAHEAGLVHRDFKPDNVLIGKDGWPRVADFGLARVQTGQTGSSTDHSAITVIKEAELAKPPLPNLTKTGVAMGTPLYMSPEQHQGEPVDSRSDQFSFCVALYEALYGQMPFAANTMQSLYFNVVSGRILPRPADSHVPTIIHEAILRGLATKPDQRFPSMSELLAALSIDIAKDAAIGPGARREVVVSMIALTLIAGLGIVLQCSGLGPQRSSLATTAILFGVLAFMALRFRRVIRKNWFHRGMLLYGFMVAAWMLALQGVGFLIGLDLSQIMTLDLLAVAALTAMTVATVLPKLWPLIPVACIGVAVATIEPRYAQTITPLMLQLGYVTSALLWYRAAIARRQKSPAQHAQ